MKRALFVTVGTTAIFAERLSLKGRDEQRRKDLKRSSALAARQKLSAELRAPLTEAHRAFWDGVRADWVPAREDYAFTSAEMVSTFGLRRSGEELMQDFFGAGREDAIVLLASSTPEGEVAAEVNQAVLHEKLLKDKCDCNGGKCAKIPVARVKGLESTEGFGNLKNGILEAVAPYQGWEAGFNITGGYKGAIPYLTWLATGKFAGAPIYYQHESMASFTVLTIGDTTARALPTVPDLIEKIVRAARLA